MLKSTAIQPHYGARLTTKRQTQTNSTPKFDDFPISLSPPKGRKNNQFRIPRTFVLADPNGSVVFELIRLLVQWL